jgi:hypothetical protein
MVSKNIKEDYGSLLNINTDIADVMTKAKSAWDGIFLEFFKYVLSQVSAPVEVNSQAFGKLLENSQEYLNKLILNARVAQFETQNFKADLSHEIDFINLTDSDNISTRITNPTGDDILPFAVLTKAPAFDYILNKFGGLFPYAEIPVMAIHPSVRSLYRWYRLYKRYVTDQRLYMQDENSMITGTILEISTKSLTADISKLLRYFDYGTQILDTDGIELLRTIVFKYSAFVIPLIAINVRNDFDLGENFTETLYNIFSNQYSGALYFQKQMFEITNTIVQSSLGIPLIRFFNFQKTISTLDLIVPNCKYNTLLHEVLAKDLRCDTVTEYINYYQNVQYAPEMIEESFKEERDGLTSFILRITRLIMLGFIVTRDTKRFKSNQDIDDARFAISRALTKLRETDNEIETSFMYKIHDELYTILQGNTVGVIQDRINAVNRDKPNRAVPANKYNNDSQFEYPGVYNDEFINNAYKFVGRNAAAQEHAAIALEIYRDRKSFAAMRDIGVRAEELATYEDVVSLLMDAESYLDIIERSKKENKRTVVEDADTQQFKLLLRNTSVAMKSQIDSLKRTV